MDLIPVCAYEPNCKLKASLLWIYMCESLLYAVLSLERVLSAAFD